MIHDGFPRMVCVLLFWAFCSYIGCISSFLLGKLVVSMEISKMNKLIVLLIIPFDILHEYKCFVNCQFITLKIKVYEGCLVWKVGCKGKHLDEVVVLC